MKYNYALKGETGPYTKYPPEIQEVWSLACRALPMMDRLAARVVWSIRAMRSTVEQARKIYAVSRGWGTGGGGVKQ